MWAYSEHAGELEMTLAQALSCSQPGKDATDDVRELMRHPKIRRQLAKISDDALVAELREVGAWDLNELSDREDNLERFVWLMANNIVDEHNDRKRR